MTTTKKVSKSSGNIKKKWDNPNWSLGAVIIGLLGKFLLLVPLLSKHQVEILHQVVVITDMVPILSLMAVNRAGDPDLARKSFSSSAFRKSFLNVYMARLPTAYFL